jgi:hypothetical protein
MTFARSSVRTAARARLDEDGEKPAGYLNQRSNGSLALGPFGAPTDPTDATASTAVSLAPPRCSVHRPCKLHRPGGDAV